MDIRVASLHSMFDEYPNLEQIQEQQANCRLELNKEFPKHTIIGIACRSIKKKGERVKLFVDIKFINNAITSRE